MMLKPKYKRKKICSYVENIVSQYDDIEFMQNFRLTRQAFHYTFSKIIRLLSLEDIIMEPKKIEKNVLAVIWLLATPECYR